MTAVFFAGVVAGWVSLSLGLGLLLGAAIRAEDRAEAQRPPVGVRDPKTGLLWDETGRLDVRA